MELGSCVFFGDTSTEIVMRSTNYDNDNDCMLDLPNLVSIHGIEGNFLRCHSLTLESNQTDKL